MSAPDVSDRWLVIGITTITSMNGFSAGSFKAEKGLTKSGLLASWDDVLPSQ